jgi:nucleotide-binding universal stress UspA family protein
MRVIKPPSDPEERRYLAYDVNIRQFHRSEAERYLRTAQDRLAQELAGKLPLRVTGSCVEEADVATALIQAAEMEEGTGSPSARGYDVIALATHGRSGITHWMIGSIAERVLEGTKLPLLIVRPQASLTTTPSSGETPIEG